MDALLYYNSHTLRAHTLELTSEIGWNYAQWIASLAGGGGSAAHKMVLETAAVGKRTAIKVHISPAHMVKRNFAFFKYTGGKLVF